jgi:hypothetical protein
MVTNKEKNMPNRKLRKLAAELQDAGVIRLHVDFSAESANEPALHYNADEYTKAYRKLPVRTLHLIRAFVTEVLPRDAANMEGGLDLDLRERRYSMEIQSSGISLISIDSDF